MWRYVERKIRMCDGNLCQIIVFKCGFECVRVCLGVFGGGRGMEGRRRKLHTSGEKNWRKGRETGEKKD